MGGNDLNLKKSWHPQLMTNQRRVYDAEQAALQERKLTEARLEEIRRERQIEETQKQLEAAGGQKRVDRVDWMYQGPNDGGRDEFSSEAFLLGKRRIDSILRGDDIKKVEKTAGPADAAPGPISVVASTRDTANKIREDPLVAIKRQEQEAYQAMMKDPSKRRQLLAQMGIIEEKPRSKKEDRHRSHRSHRRHRDDDPDYERRHRRRHADSRDRSRSPRRHADDSDYERSRKRRRADSRDKSPPRRRHEDDSDDAGRRRSRRSNSQDGPRHESDERHRDSGTRRDGADRRRYDSNDRQDRRDRRPSPDRRRIHGSNRDITRSANRENDEEERARKLAAMQNDATDLDRAREARLAALAEKEKADREADDRARAEANKYGGRQFANKLHNAAGNQSLADRIGRGRQGLQRDDD
ncbi:Pre-mRNA-splicing factor CWC25 [Cytospora mali]|uniref:Pre-mRNA-splicing factor CWC25 n=1 Tax=Cytospora mali TaxID=578113 RepID=A0A194WAA5_CYTMA|nr:Pre-mRNA-splicing factor CWC25 [Valsa mali]